MKRLTLAAALVLAVASAASAQGRLYSNSYAGEAPPALEADAENWINSDGAHSLESLKGRVVYLEFSFLH